MFLLPTGEFGPVLLAAVQDDQAGTPVATVRDHRGLPDGVLGAGQLPRLAVVAVAGQLLATATTSRVSASMTTWWLVGNL
ncbi:hypothetical protein Stsp01_66330 [Streptomyces sp. NBRC 13847]|nr:hypothetical protein Stsp01_66330 [Streptomyces sp. NBRC 13847]